MDANEVEPTLSSRPNSALDRRLKASGLGWPQPAWSVRVSRGRLRGRCAGASGPADGCRMAGPAGSPIMGYETAASSEIRCSWGANWAALAKICQERRPDALDVGGGYGGLVS